MPKKSTKEIDLQKNLKLYYGAVGVIILGYIFLSIGDANSVTSLTLGPIILVIGYLVAMPIALLAGVGKKEEEKQKETGDNKQEPLSKKQANK
ncbi:MAG: hypothetical protein JXB48_08225 [Candidatus Latescibacteria bacterium]|nr:hypothetical protein [Candidatus Latescibacterota bacterium]